VRGFFRERLEFYLKDARGYAYDVVSAVLAVDSDDVVDAAARPSGEQGARLGRLRIQGRNILNAVLDRRALHETDLLAFQIAITSAHPPGNVFLQPGERRLRL